MENRANTLPLAIFCLATVLAVVRLYRLRYLGTVFTDEADNFLVGYQIAHGARLYLDVFSHHAPLPYLLSSISAFVASFIGGSFATLGYRLWILLTLLLSALAIAKSPLFRERSKQGFFAASIYLLMYLCTMVSWKGFSLLGQTLLGQAMVGILFLLVLPLLFGAPISSKSVSKEPASNGSVSKRDAAIAGALFCISLAATQVSVFPVFLLTLALLVLAKSKRELIPPLLLGFAIALLVFALWISLFASWNGMYRQAILFNLEVYSKYRHGSSSVLLWSGLLTWVKVIYWTLANPVALLADGIVSVEALGLLSFVLSLGLVLLKTMKEKERYRIPIIVALTVFWIAFLLSLRVRSGEGSAFHDSPFHIVSLALLGWGLVEFLQSASSLSLRCLATTCGLLTCIFSAFVLFNDGKVDWNEASRKRSLGQRYAAAEHIRNNTKPEDRIAVFNVWNDIYMAAERQPATWSNFYLPWVADWEDRPDVTSSCEQLAIAKPRFVYMEGWTVWRKYPWAGYASCINKYVKKNYRQVNKPGVFNLWERN